MSKKIIVADDRENWSEMYVYAVNDACPDAEISQVKTGVDLVKKVLEGKYNLVITDSNMIGENDGLEAIKKLHEHDSTLPIYMVSATGGIRETALQYGEKRFYDKSKFDLDQLTEDIKSDLGGK